MSEYSNIVPDVTRKLSDRQNEKNAGKRSKSRTTTPEPPRPVSRRLQGYAFDPSLSVQLETAVLNETVFRVPWEQLETGPVGEYLEVIDYDPASGSFYPPVDLDHPFILANDGLTPSEGNPQFHQQMVYAVAMTTIKNFEKALGRWAFWGTYFDEDHKERDNFVRRLRIYPHALREANAYYSPQKKSLLFGYFPASEDAPGDHIPGGIVFTCLSHDIIAHETTHALLDGMYERFIEANHPDSLAFHEAFADIVALFQHFSFPDVLRHQIAKTRGDLNSQNLLGELAQQFGKAVGGYGALRDAIGKRDSVTGKWTPQTPNPEDYVLVNEPHARGSILVAAVFDAFLSIYRSRTEDLMRIASGGTGILPQGALHPDLVKRLAKEAATASQQVLNICVRALDYCPPVDINFGDYLRAIITADMDLVPEDDKGYRIAFIEAFRRRGIYPRDIRTLSEESLRWPLSRADDNEDFEEIAKLLRKEIHVGQYLESREESFRWMKRLTAEIHDFVYRKKRSPDQRDINKFEEITGLVLRKDHPEKERVAESPTYKGWPLFHVESVRQARRIGPTGAALDQVVITILQRRPQETLETGQQFTFRGGCSLILDLKDLRLRYVIRKEIVGERAEKRYARQKRYRVEKAAASFKAIYFGGLANDDYVEPFAILHRNSSVMDEEGA